MAKNNNLHKAAKEKNDEFYTQLSDIEKELKHYKKYFEGKVVFCNCDDPKWSNFYKFFISNFKEYKLKKLITTHFDKVNPSYKLVIDEDTYDIEMVNEIKNNVYKYGIEISNDNKNPKLIPLKQNGDFRSPESIELLKEADIIVTNPPFSLFREYISQLIEYDKKFLVIGNNNSVTYKEVFKLIKENKIWLGVSPRSMKFILPKENKSNISEKEEFATVNASWFTNLTHKKRNEEVIPYKTYKDNEKNYPKYENYDAIEVSKITDIPTDYTGLMGVPITFLDKYNPEQFEIVALGIVGSINFTSNRKMEILDKNGIGTGKFTMNAKGTLYRKYDPKIDKKSPAFKDFETGELYSSIYARILIKHKKINKGE